PPESGNREVVVRVVFGKRDPAHPSGGVVFDRIVMMEHADGRDRLVVRMAALDPTLHARSPAQPPTGTARFAAGGRARESEASVVAGDAAIWSPTAQPLRVTLDGAPLAVGDGAGRETALRFDARAVHRLAVAAPDGGAPRGDVWFLQPDALALTGASLGRRR